MTLKQFKGPKSLEAINEQCVALDLILRRDRHDTFMDDFVVVQWPTAPEAAVYFNTVSGWFFGTTDTGETFDSRDSLDDKPWFNALMEFFYEPLTALNLGELSFEERHLAFIDAIRAPEPEAGLRHEAAQ